MSDDFKGVKVYIFGFYRMIEGEMEYRYGFVYILGVFVIFVIFWVVKGIFFRKYEV